MTRWARTKSAHRHERLPKDSTPWSEFVEHVTSEENTSKAHGSKDMKKSSKLKKIKNDKTKSVDLVQDKKNETHKQKVRTGRNDTCDLQSFDRYDTEVSKKSPSFKKSKSSEFIVKKQKKAKLKKFCKSDELNKSATNFCNVKSQETEVSDSQSKENEVFHMNKQSGEKSQLPKKAKRKRMNSQSIHQDENEPSKKQRKSKEKSEEQGILMNTKNAKSFSEETTKEKKDEIENKVSKTFKNKKNEMKRRQLLKKRQENGIILLPPKVEKQIYRLKKSLRNKGLSGEDIRQIVRQKRRGEELKYRKTLLKVCFRCRKPGHMIAQCPILEKDMEQGTSICFTCGSTEHMISRCPARKLGKESFPFAKCFICGEQGHLSRQCSKNPNGLYPKGGNCKMCGSVEHLKKDCPELQPQEETTCITAEMLDTTQSVDAEPMKEFSHQGIMKSDPKVVKFL
ncbi:zinc finger CCHC domain-containing protein 9-like [Limulus polyphemus]|uniref:Zinc finger CCHC domain-containing protein 9-like n=1 Tax=Limulus polyphemus TaxID=6850 RepID=A0ABM1SGE5_LIMPO|nr:zinc finger CCHC domain-containing protein 9-like [Limulus polyphemus]XP_013775443.1 zinc finger CCHC domain-containing protein 9-like [Limulus polyphemus]XP_022242700.1 zinc finger CCHC domain-containing protein 9-like [Limulus polyphemus]